MVHSRHYGSPAHEASVSLGNSGPGRDPEEVLAELTEKTKKPNNTTGSKGGAFQEEKTAGAKFVKWENMAHPGDY